MATARVKGASENIHTFGTVGAGRDYQSMVTWESDHTINLATADKSEILECYDDAASFDISGCTIAGATNSSATRFRCIRPGGTKTSGWQGHDGTPNNGFYIANTTAATVFSIQEAYFQLQDLIVYSSYSSASGIEMIYLTTNSANAKVVGCIGKAINASTGGTRVFAAAGAGSDKGFIDCLSYGVSSTAGDSTAFKMQANSSVTVYAYNCTAVNTVGTNSTGWGFRMNVGVGTGTVVLTNCLSQGGTNPDADFISDGTVTATVTYCLSKDATADDWAGAGNVISKTLTFANAAGLDYHLASTDTDAIDAGTSLAATFDDDIDFTVRGASWDIGFDEYVAAGGGLDLSTKRIVLCG